MVSLLAPRALVRPRGKVVGVDIDEVLCPLLPPMMKWKGFEAANGIDFDSRIYATFLKSSNADSQKMVQEFYESEEFVNLEPIHRARAGIAFLKARGHRLYAITDRHPYARLKTEQWLDTHFPYAFDDVVISQHGTSKPSLCEALNIGLMIDDNIQVCTECENRNIKGVNFIGDPIYPWCKDNKLAVRRWDDIVYSALI